MSDTSVSKSAGLGQRYSDLSLQGVVSDIELLSETDFIVCTFSSQVNNDFCHMYVCFVCSTDYLNITRNMNGEL